LLARSDPGTSESSTPASSVGLLASAEGAALGSTKYRVFAENFSDLFEIVVLASSLAITVPETRPDTWETQVPIGNDPSVLNTVDIWRLVPRLDAVIGESGSPRGGSS
jgi:hypothetical protein